MTAIRVILQSARLALFQPLGNSGVDLKGWLANQNYFIDSDIQKSQFSIRPSQPNEVAQALAHDLNRMSCAAFESAAGVGPDITIPRSLAWGAIRSYYSAFFAAHAFMRMFGSGCVQLETDHVNKIFSSATLFGKTGTLNALDAGFFHVEISPNFDSLTFVRLRDSHKDTWGTLINVIEKIDNAIPSATALSKHKIDASALLTDLKSGLSRAGSNKGNWLSTMRNSINYQQSHGVWFPFSSKEARADLLDSASRSWLTAPSPRGTTHATDLENFFQTSTGLVTLCRELICAAAALHDPMNPVVRNGCIKLLNDVKATKK